MSSQVHWPSVHEEPHQKTLFQGMAAGSSPPPLLQQHKTTCNILSRTNKDSICKFGTVEHSPSQVVFAWLYMLPNGGGNLITRSAKPHRDTPTFFLVARLIRRKGANTQPHTWNEVKAARDPRSEAGNMALMGNIDVAASGTRSGIMTSLLCTHNTSPYHGTSSLLTGFFLLSSIYPKLPDARRRLYVAIPPFTRMPTKVHLT